MRACSILLPSSVSAAGGIGGGLESASIIAKELGLRPAQVSSTLALFGEGATLPFIARYRKEATGGLDEVQIGAIQARAEYLVELGERKLAVLKQIEAS